MAAAAAISAIAAAGGAAAQGIDGATAAGQLFPVNKVAVGIARGALKPDEVAVIRQVAGQQKYYGAVAISPDEGIMSEATVAAANHHSVGAARRQAIDSCNARRKKGSARCTIVADILPAGFAPRAFSLSRDATEGFGESYGDSGERALAISPATGAWSIARGKGAARAAVKDCNRKAAANGARDCKLAVRD